MSETLLKKRVHPVFTLRMPQLNLNRLAKTGGRPYINARLWRAPNETDAQWSGDAEEGITGRRERSCLVNDAGRIADKIRQYIFKRSPQRDGADDLFVANCSGDGVSIDDFMGRVCDALTTGQWCWVQVDTPPRCFDENGQPIVQTLENKPRVFWRLWESCDVPDWCIEDDGTLRWLITRSKIYDNSDPFREASKVTLSTLYFLNPADGRVHITETVDGTTNIPLRVDEVMTDLDRLPFVCVGKPSPDAWWFDDVENIQAQVMNYESMHNETLTDAVYPQLIVPMSLLNTLDTNISLENLGAKKLITLQRELIKGRKNPFYETPEDRGTTRYIQPNSGDLSLITTEAERKRRLLFDMCGFALFNRESRQVQTAESKAFDQLDTNATLGNRALLLQRVETRLVELSVYFDPSFGVYQPVYSTKFDVVDVSALSQTIQIISNMPHATPEMQKVCLRAGMRLILEAGGIDDETYQKVLDEIDALDATDFDDSNPFDAIEGEDEPSDKPKDDKGEPNDDDDDKDDKDDK